MAAPTQALENPAKLLARVPAILFVSRINLPKRQFSLKYISRGAIELLGLDARQFDANGFEIADFGKLIHPADIAVLEARFAETTRTAGRFHEQCRLLPPRGGVRWLDVVADPEPQADGSIVWHGIATDITAVKQAEDEFRRSQERFELAAQAGGIGVWDIDLETGECVWDDRMHSLYGISPGTFDGDIETWRGMMTPDAVERTFRGWEPRPDGGMVLDSEFEICRPDGRRLHVRGLARVIRDEHDVPKRAVGVNLDITEHWEMERRLEHMATHDALTGLPNRVTFERRLAQACVQANDEKREHVLCFMDLDRFKIVNDSAGHAAGDAFLRMVGDLITSSCGERDFTARLGGDEFALLLFDCSPGGAERRARALIDAIRALRLPWDGKIYDIGASIGITAISARSPSPVELMSQADVACYAAKTGGRNQVVLYGGRNGAAERHHREIMVASGIRRAIEADRLELYAQEILALGPSVSKGRNVELLLRMTDASGRLLRPGSFIPAAERYDLMGNLDRWVIENALITRGEAIAAIGNLSISINLSANSLNDPLFADFLREALVASRLPPERVNFEITETAMIDNLDAAWNFMSTVRAAGHALVLDDFGTGLSSFNYLKKFVVDGLKIDGSFIRQLKTSPVDRVIVESINEIAHKLGIKTVAEFVEDTQTLEIVRAIGIDNAQGYIIGRPMPLDAVIAEQAIGRAARI